MSTNASPLVSSSADMISALPSDAMAELSSVAPDASTPETPDTGDLTVPEAIETPEETPAEGETEPAAEPEPEPEPEVPATEEAPPAEPATPAEELPEGVRKGKDSSGKEGLFVTPQRWNTIYGDHKAVREMSEMIGEPLTAEALKTREAAFVGSEKLYGDLFSGDPEAQRAVLDHFFEQAQARVEAGEVGADPMVPFTSTMYQALKDRNSASQTGDPAYRELRFSAAKDLVGELFHEAAKSGDENLLLSMQHVVRALSQAGKDVTDAAVLRQIAERQGLPFYTKAEMQNLAKGQSPEATLRAENEALKAQLSGRSTTSQAAQFETWQGAVKQAVATSVLESGVKAALAEDSQKGVWATSPKAFERLVTEPLHREVSAKLAADPVLLDKVARLTAEAKRAVSAQVRDAKRQQIETAYAIRARQIADASKKAILNDAAQTLKGQSDATHQRRAAAQKAGAGPKGAATTPQHSLLPDSMTAPKPGGRFDVNEAVKQAGQFLYGR